MSRLPRIHGSTILLLLGLVILEFGATVPVTPGTAGAAGSAAPVDRRGPVSYQLGRGSVYEEGCFAPCMCPIMLNEGLRGSFERWPSTREATFEVFTVRNVKFIVPRTLTSTDPVLITGAGIYRIDRAAGLQQLQLDVRFPGRGLVHFDSGLVATRVDFPGIAVTISMNNLFCRDIALVINAAPSTSSGDPRITPRPIEFVPNAPSGDQSWGMVKALYRG
jgi:hypothetical protein